MAGFQQITLIGNLGADPEMKFLPSGQAVTNFSLAVTRRWNDRASNEKREETIWFRCAAWGALAEVVNTYARKGQQVFLTGRVGVRAYTNNAGEAAASLEVNVDTFQLLGSRGDSNGTPAPAADANDIPF